MAKANTRESRQTDREGLDWILWDSKEGEMKGKNGCEGFNKVGRKYVPCNRHLKYTVSWAFNNGVKVCSLCAFRLQKAIGFRKEEIE